MMIERMIDRISEYLAHNKAMPVFAGVLLVILNYGVQFLAHVPGLGFIASTNLLLHLGIVVGLLGILLGDAL
jgi:hypothetical protein